MAPEVEELVDTVAGDAAQGHVEDGVEFLEGLFFRLGDEEEDEDPADEVPGRVPREGALRGPGLDDGRPGQGEHGVEEPGRRRC